LKLVAQIKLMPTIEQRTALLATMERFNVACDWLGGEAFAAKCASKLDLQRDRYETLRAKFDLPAQLAIRAISKVCEVYKRDKSIRPHFKPRGAVPYDERILSFKAADRVSIKTLDKQRALIPFVVGDYHRALLAAERGQADLILRTGNWYLYVTIEVPDGTSIKPIAMLGVDLGLGNIATDSDGDRYTGDAIEAIRVRLLNHRSDLQASGSKRSKRTLKKLAGKESRFRSNTHHTLSKRLVAKAKGTGRAIALEDLQGIRDRGTVKKSQRARHSGWSFFPLREFVTYKATLAGVPRVLVDPRNTSRTCPECGHCDKAHRRSQSEFVCKSCGYAAHADYVGARNIARRAPVHGPLVGVVDGGNTETIHRVPRSRRLASPGHTGPPVGRG
jgi:putative transposase